MKGRHLVIFLAVLSFLMGCNYNPFILNNRTTGSPVGAAVGAGIGGGTVGALGGSKYLIGLSAIGGGAIGYYVTTLRYDAGGVIQSGGQVFKVGEFVGINISSDKLFEPNTADFLPQAEAILASAAAVLSRYPTNNILVSGNTSGFGRARWERRLSEERAKKVSAYLWQAGISPYKPQSLETRKLAYVGYGYYFPIAHHYKNDSIRQNSRIQITSYPGYCDLYLQSSMARNNIGALDDTAIADAMHRCLTHGKQADKQVYRRAACSKDNECDED